MGVILQAPEGMGATSLTVDRSTYKVADGRVEVDPAHAAVLEQRFGFERAVGKARAPARRSAPAAASMQAEKGTGDGAGADPKAEPPRKATRRRSKSPGKA